MDKVALVTGASGDGIGRSTAITLAKDGFKVIINYRTKQSLAELICSYINNNGGIAIPVKANIFNKNECSSLLDEILLKFKKLNACIIGPGAGWNPESPENLNSQEALTDVIHEIEPVYYLVPQIIKIMKQEKYGSIIGIASNPDLPSPSYSYNVAKNSRINAFLGLVPVCWKYKIRVNIIAPGPVEHFKNFESAKDALDNEEKVHQRITPQDIAGTISFICSKKGRYITGTVFKYNF